MSTSYDSYRRWFVAKDIKELLGITPGQLFHWGKTWGLIKPEIRAEGRQGKDKYSYKNLLFLELISNLLEFGINLKNIGAIIKTKRQFPPSQYVLKEQYRGHFIKPKKYQICDIFDYQKKFEESLGDYYKGKEVVFYLKISKKYYPRRNSGEYTWDVDFIASGEPIGEVPGTFLQVNLRLLIQKVETSILYYVLGKKLKLEWRKLMVIHIDIDDDFVEKELKKLKY